MSLWILIFLPLCLGAQRGSSLHYWVENDPQSLIQNKVRETHIRTYSEQDSNLVRESIYTFRKPGLLQSILYISFFNGVADTILIPFDQKGLCRSYSTYKTQEGKKVLIGTYTFEYDSEGRILKMEMLTEAGKAPVVREFYYGEKGGQDSILTSGPEGHYFPKVEVWDLDAQGRITQSFGDGQLRQMYDYADGQMVRRRWGAYEDSYTTQHFYYDASGLIRSTRSESNGRYNSPFIARYSYRYF